MKIQGFTLIELMVVLALLTLLLSQGIPSLQRLMHRHQQDTARQQLMGAMALTRSEAITRGQAVTLQQKDDDWMAGWQIFIDENDDAHRDEDELLLHTHKAMAGEVTISGNLPVSRYIRYNSLGESELYSGAFQAGTLTFCHSNPALSNIALVLSANGRIRLESQTDTSCD